MKPFTVLIGYGEYEEKPGECFTDHVTTTDTKSAISAARVSMYQANDGYIDVNDLPVIAVFAGHLEHEE